METNTGNHAQRELDILLRTVKDPIIKDFVPELLAIAEKFGNSGQSGGSAPYTASALSQAVKHLCLQQPICPITGDDDEWNRISEMNGGEEMYQNNRCSALFKDGIKNKAYYIDAIVWQGAEEYDTFTGGVYIDNVNFELIGSRQFVKLPFEPKTFYIDVVRVPIKKEEAENRNLHYIENNPSDCYYTILKDPKQLEEVFKYYDKF